MLKEKHKCIENYGKGGDNETAINSSDISVFEIQEVEFNTRRRKMQKTYLLFVLVAISGVGLFFTSKAFNAEQSVGIERKWGGTQKNMLQLQGKIKEALELRNNNDIAGAIQIIKEILAGDPNNVGAMTFLGEFYKASGDLESGLASVDKALSIDPKNTFALSVKGDILINKKEYNEAIEVLNKALSLCDPKTSGHAMCNAKLSRVYANQGDEEKAKSYMEKAVADDPSNPGLKKQLEQMKNLAATNSDNAIEK